MHQPSHRQVGSALVFTLLCIIVLSLLVGETLRLVTTKYQNVFHAASWQVSLLAAESGVDLAMVELRKSLQDPASSWQAPWSGVAPGDATTSYSMSTVTFAGEGGTKLTMEVSVDAPSQLVDSDGWQYYRIRSTGTATVPGPSRSTDEKRDATLRKLSLQFDRFTGRRVVSPQVSRRLEVIARPRSPFNAAILARGKINITDQNVIIDSYDSRYSEKSTLGQYDVTKRQSNGDVATDGTVLSAGNAQIFGDLGTNEGTPTGIANVTGTIRSDFYQDIRAVNPLNWLSVTGNSGPVTTTQTRAASATDGAARYIISKIALQGNDILTFTGNPSGAPTYIEIWVKGDFNVSGNAQILVQDGVRAKIYVQDTTTIAGNGIVNGTSATHSNRPANTMIYGLPTTDGSKLKISLAGNAQLEAGIYAPDADITLNGGGSHGSFCGSVVGDTVTLTGVTNVHYDEAMAVAGAVTDYKIASWFEDTR